MNTNSIAKIIEKKLHLVRSKDNKKLQQRVGRNNIGNGYYTIHDFVGDFRVKKYLDDWRDTDLYRVYLDSGKAINMIDDIVDVLNDIDEVNIEFINKNSIDFTFKNLEESLTEFLNAEELARKSIKEQFVGKGEGGYRKPDKTKFNSGICLDSNGVKHTVIFDTRVEDFIVWVDDDNYLMWYVSSPQSLLNNLAESDLDENLILDIVALWEKLSKKHIKN